MDNQHYKCAFLSGHGKALILPHTPYKSSNISSNHGTVIFERGKPRVEIPAPHGSAGLRTLKLRGIYYTESGMRKEYGVAIVVSKLKNSGPLQTSEDSVIHTLKIGLSSAQQAQCVEHGIEPSVTVRYE